MAIEQNKGPDLLEFLNRPAVDRDGQPKNIIPNWPVIVDFQISDKSYAIFPTFDASRTNTFVKLQDSDQFEVLFSVNSDVKKHSLI